MVKRNKFVRGHKSLRPPVLLPPPPLEGEPVPLPLQHDWGNQPLHLRGSELLLLAVLQGKGPLDDVLADIVLLGQVKQLPGSLRVERRKRLGQSISKYLTG